MKIITVILTSIWVLFNYCLVLNVVPYTEGQSIALFGLSIITVAPIVGLIIIHFFNAGKLCP